MSQDEVMNIVGAVQQIMKKIGIEHHCIEASALLASVFHRRGFPDAYLLTVGVEILSPTFIKWIDEHGFPETDEQQEACDAAGGRVIHLGAGHDQEVAQGQWKGHLIVVVPNCMDGRDCMFDLALPQVNSVASDINMKPLVTKLNPDGSFVDGNEKMTKLMFDCSVRYTAYPKDKSFNSEGDCMQKQGLDLAVADVQELLGH